MKRLGTFGLHELINSLSNNTQMAGFVRMQKILVVGAGFAGAVYARMLAEGGYIVTVIDRRSHIGGNCFDYIHESGVRVHKYGPHLFHTSNHRVVAWLSQFTSWVDYNHRVVAKIDGDRLVPLPINRKTLNITLGLDLKTSEQVEEYLTNVSSKDDVISNAEDWLFANIGKKLTDLYFRPYTKKMWNLDLSDMDASVVKRINIRVDDDDRYFPLDTFQGMPAEGYTNLFEKIFEHERINVLTNIEFDKKMLPDYDFCFNSMPIDVFFDYEFGDLPYRSIKFHTKIVRIADAASEVTINYTDSGPYTRETWWHNIPNHHLFETGEVVCTVEEPCDYKENYMERYYPVKTHDRRYENVYQLYSNKAKELRNMQFIGRCGTYQYLDMHQVINQSLIGAAKWLTERQCK
ncbi:UDP-galactopyranose mutase [Methylobacterium sp. B4]|uniref:UDP-galactopyranose mutase n=1 Tax=Methylobacterium sp. B4 TaxID=1938755 RepID=UPI001FE0AA63|nr:UDP-galactopyranose mutase [Methylobacterium sp. B4]